MGNMGKGINVISKVFKFNNRLLNFVMAQKLQSTVRNFANYVRIANRLNFNNKPIPAQQIATISVLHAIKIYLDNEVV